MGTVVRQADSPHLPLDRRLTLSPLNLLPHLLFAFSHLCFIFLTQCFCEGRKEIERSERENRAWHPQQCMPITKLASPAALGTKVFGFCFE